MRVGPRCPLGPEREVTAAAAAACVYRTLDRIEFMYHVRALLPQQSLPRLEPCSFQCKCNCFMHVPTSEFRSSFLLRYYRIYLNHEP